MTGTDPSTYKILKIVHNRTAYSSIPEVFAAWHRGELRRTIDDKSTWASRAIQGKQRDLDDRAGPRQVMFDGARHRVDKDEDWVSWMDWSFYFSFERDMGLHLWDMCVFRSHSWICADSPSKQFWRGAHHIRTLATRGHGSILWFRPPPILDSMARPGIWHGRERS